MSPPLLVHLKGAILEHNSEHFPHGLRKESTTGHAAEWQLIDSLPHLLPHILAQGSSPFLLNLSCPLCSHACPDQLSHCHCLSLEKTVWPENSWADRMASLSKQALWGQGLGRLPLRVWGKALSVYWGHGRGVRAGILWTEKEFFWVCGLVLILLGKLSGVNWEIYDEGKKSILVK